MGEPAPQTRPSETQAGASQRAGLRPLASLLPYLAAYRVHLAAAIFALLAAAAATLAIPLAVRRMIDHGFVEGDAAFIDRYFLMLIVVVAALAAASAARYYFVTWLGERVVADLRAEVFAHVTRLSPAFFDRSHSGEIVSRLTADTTQIKSAVGASASIALRNLAMFVGAGVMMAVTSPVLAAYVLIAIPVVVLPIVAFGRAVRKRSRNAQDVLAGASAYAGEAIGAVRTLQAFGRERDAAARYAGEVETAFRAARAATGARAVLTGSAILTVFASIVLILWIGAKSVVAGSMSAGELGQFVLYAVLAAGALGELSQVWGEVSQAAGAAERLAELKAEIADIRSPAAPVPFPEPPHGAVVFEGVSFQYPARTDTRVLRGIDLEVRPGETVAVVGPSGAGKSTLFQLLMRAYDPTVGRVLIDGVDIALAELGAVRGHIAIVPQETAIFAASVRENLRLGRPDAEDSEIEAAAQAANAHDFIKALPQGYETPLGERGVTLSGGERQRVAIARAMLRDAPILLLDEATSALDAASEALVQDALAVLSKGRTTLVIAHRLATVRRADRIVVMEDGRIAEQGDHASLMARGGLYARLARLQFREREDGDAPARLLTAR